MLYKRLVAHFLYFLLALKFTYLAIESHEADSINLVNLHSFHVTILYELRYIL